MVKRKFKPVLPSMREKKRYLVFEVLSNGKISFDEVYNAIINGAMSFIGQLGMAKAGIIVLEDKWNEKMQRGILKVSHKSVDALRASLLFITKIGNEPVIVKSVGLSGILKKAENRYIKLNVD